MALSNGRCSAVEKPKMLKTYAGALVVEVRSRALHVEVCELLGPPSVCGTCRQSVAYGTIRYF